MFIIIDLSFGDLQNNINVDQKLRHDIPRHQVKEVDIFTCSFPCSPQPLPVTSFSLEFIIIMVYTVTDWILCLSLLPGDMLTLWDWTRSEFYFLFIVLVLHWAFYFNWVFYQLDFLAFWKWFARNLPSKENIVCFVASWCWAVLVINMLTYFLCCHYQVQQVCINCGVCMGEYFCKTCKLFDDDVSGLILSVNWLCSWKCLRSILFYEFEEINPPRIRVTNLLTSARMLVTKLGLWHVENARLAFYH